MEPVEPFPVFPDAQQVVVVPDVSVRIFVWDPSAQRILMVHERPPKPPGSGLPGGKVDGTSETIVTMVRKLMPVMSRLDPDGPEAAQLWAARPLCDERIWWTAVKEAIEETGQLILPSLYREWKTYRNHRVDLLIARSLGGTILTRSVETDDCGWFEPKNIPADTYRSHRTMIAWATAQIGIQIGEEPA